MHVGAVRPATLRARHEHAVHALMAGNRDVDVHAVGHGQRGVVGDGMMASDENVNLVGLRCFILWNEWRRCWNGEHTVI